MRHRVGSRVHEDLQARLRSNNLVGTNPKAANYIGKHPGNAFMELQFDGPGYVPQFEGFGCDATHYCAVLTIDSRTEDQNHGAAGTTGTENTADCNNYILGGPEPINWAWVTRNGRLAGAREPAVHRDVRRTRTSRAVNPDLTKDLLMNPGDRILIHMHDTPAGFQVILVDLTTHQSGSMTASIANGFGHILYTPNSCTCQEAPYAFHPEYSTAKRPREHLEHPHVQHRDVRRDRPLRELPRDRRQPELHRPGLPGCRCGLTRTTERLLRPRHRLDRGHDRRLLQPR